MYRSRLVSRATDFSRFARLFEIFSLFSTECSSDGFLFMACSVSAMLLMVAVLLLLDTATLVVCWGRFLERLSTEASRASNSIGGVARLQELWLLTL